MSKPNKTHIENTLKDLIQEIETFIPEGDKEDWYIAVKLGMFLSLSDTYVTLYYRINEEINKKRIRYLHAYNLLRNSVIKSHNYERDRKHEQTQT